MSDGQDWRESVPEALRDFTVVKEAKDSESAFNAVAESLRYADKLRGSSLRIPSGEAPPEDLAKFADKVLNHTDVLMRKPDLDNAEVMKDFYKSLGMPEDSAGYSLPDTYDGKVNTDKIEQFRKVALDIGLNKNQFSKAIEGVIGPEIQAAEAANLRHEDALTSLKAEWGSGYDNQYKKAEFIRDEFFGDVLPADQAMPADLIRSLNKIAKQLGSESDSLTARIPDNGHAGITPEEALSRADEILRSDAFKAGDPVAIKKRKDYFKIAYPS